MKYIFAYQPLSAIIHTRSKFLTRKEILIMATKKKAKKKVAKKK
jgi:hypothetical protein